MSEQEKEDKRPLRTINALAKLLKDNAHIQSIEVAGDSIKIVAQPQKVETQAVKAVGALKAPPVVEAPVDEYTAFMNKLNKEFGVSI